MKAYLVYFIGIISAVDENSAKELAQEFLHKHDLHQIVINNVKELGCENIGSCLEINKKESK